MVVSAFNIFIVEYEKPSNPRDPGLLREDNKPAAHWINRCRGGKELTSGAVMRVVGVLEGKGGWKFEPKHIPGILNREANASRAGITERGGGSKLHFSLSGYLAAGAPPIRPKGWGCVL